MCQMPTLRVELLVLLKVLIMLLRASDVAACCMHLCSRMQAPAAAKL